MLQRSVHASQHVCLATRNLKHLWCQVQEAHQPDGGAPGDTGFDVLVPDESAAAASSTATLDVSVHGADSSHAVPVRMRARVAILL